MGDKRFYLFFLAVMLALASFSSVYCQPSELNISKEQQLPIKPDAVIQTPSFGLMSNLGDVYEYDDTAGYATTIYTNSTIQTHSFHTSTDKDYIKFDCIANETYNVTVNNSDTYIITYNSTQSVFANNYYYNGAAYVIKSPSTIFFCSQSETIYVLLMYKYASTITYNVRVGNITVAVPSTELDNSYHNATAIEANGTRYNGTFQFFSNDQDFLKFNATAGNIYVIETYNNTSGMDTYLNLYDTDNITVLKYNDDASKYFNSRILWNCTSSGVYHVSVWDKYGKTGNYSIDIYVPTIPTLSTTGTPLTQTFSSTGATNYTNFTAVNGTKYVVRAQNNTPSMVVCASIYNNSFNFLRGGCGNYVSGTLENNTIFTWYAPSNGTYYIEVSDQYIKGENFNVSVNSSFPPGPNDSFEPDDYFDVASLYNASNTNHSFYYYGESDFVKINLTESKIYKIRTQNRTSSLVDTYVKIYNSSKALLDFNDDVGSNCSTSNPRDCLSELYFYATANDTYYIESYDISSAGNNYSLEITDTGSGSLTLQFITPTTNKNVTKYGVFEVTANVSCSGFCGNVTLTLDPEELKEEKIMSMPPKMQQYSEFNRYIIILKEQQKSEYTPSSIGTDMVSIKAQAESLQNNFIQSAPEVQVTARYSLFKMMAVELTPEQVAELRNNPYVEDIVPDKVLHLNLNTSTKQIHANDTWAVQYNAVNINGTGQTVCIIDTGVNYSHPALGGCYGNNNRSSNCKVIGGYDFCADNAGCNTTDNDPMDVYGHGTHVAGIVASNDTNYTGVAPDSRIVMIKVSNSSGENIWESNIIAGIDWCTSNASNYNISVISMSLGGLDSTGLGWNNTAQCSLDNKAWVMPVYLANSNNISVVAASGNNGNGSWIATPACIEGVIAVGSVSKTDTISGFSNAAPILDLLAPGGDGPPGGCNQTIISTVYNGGFEGACGTSMATPHVAGAILLLNQYNKLRFNKVLTPAAVLQTLNDTGLKINDTRNNINFSRIDVFAALQENQVQKNVIPMNSGVPFFTTSQNPVYPTNNSCLQNMNSSSCVLTWVVNATGDYNSTWEFYIKSESNYFNISSAENESAKINITITSQNLAPAINVISPGNGTLAGAGNLTINTSVVCNTSLVSSVTYVLKNSSDSTVASGSLVKLNETNYWGSSISQSLIASGNHTLNITATNALGLTSSSIVYLIVDNQYPTITVNTTYPQNTSQPWLNITATDEINLSYIFYSLDNGTNVTIWNTTINATSVNTALNLTYPGLHHLDIYANDTSGNLKQYSSDFHEIFQFNATNWSAYHSNRTNASISTAPTSDAISNNQFFNITMNTTNFNVTLYSINGTVLRWDYNFRLEENNSMLFNITRNYGSRASNSIYLDENLTSNLSLTDYAAITFGQNSSQYTGLYNCNRGIPTDFSTCSKITDVCSGYNGTACYNYSASSTTVFLPRFSTLVITNDTTGPSITAVSPTNSYNYTNGSIIYTLVATINTSADTSFCNYTLNSTSIGTTNKTNSTTSTTGKTQYTWTIGPLKNGIYNLTYFCKDLSNNPNTTNISFVVNDTVIPSYSAFSTNSQNSSDTLIWWTTTEPIVNATIYYGKTISYGSVMQVNYPYPNCTIYPQIQLTGLTAGTVYHYYAKFWDYQGNPATTALDNQFTTPAAANSSAPPSDSDSSSTTTKIVIAFGTVPADAITIISLNNKYIAVRRIEFALSQAQDNVKIEVAYLGNTSGNPAPDKIYQYFSITSYALTNKFKSLKIKFEVPNSWFTNSSTDPDTLKLYHYKSGAWVEETITKLSTNPYTYESNLYSLSNFAITAEALANATTAVCNNSICEAGETCTSCPADCGNCTAQNNTQSNETNTTCGNGVCGENETCSSCSADCGQCKLLINLSDLESYLVPLVLVILLVVSGVTVYYVIVIKKAKFPEIRLKAPELPELKIKKAEFPKKEKEGEFTPFKLR